MDVGSMCQSVRKKWALLFTYVILLTDIGRTEVTCCFPDKQTVENTYQFLCKLNNSVVYSCFWLTELRVLFLLQEELRFQIVWCCRLELGAVAAFSCVQIQHIAKVGLPFLLSCFAKVTSAYSLLSSSLLQWNGMITFCNLHDRFKQKTSLHLQSSDSLRF